MESLLLKQLTAGKGNWEDFLWRTIEDEICLIKQRCLELVGCDEQTDIPNKSTNYLGKAKFLCWSFEKC